MTESLHKVKELTTLEARSVYISWKLSAESLMCCDKKNQKQNQNMLAIMNVC